MPRDVLTLSPLLNFRKTDNYINYLCHIIGFKKWEKVKIKPPSFQNLKRNTELNIVNDNNKDTKHITYFLKI